MRVKIVFGFLISVFYVATAHALLAISAKPSGPSEEQVSSWRAAVLESPGARRALGNSEYRVLATEWIPRENPKKLALQVYDYTRGRLLVFEAPLGELSSLSIRTSKDQPIPNQGEFEAAAKIAEEDPELGAKIKSGELLPYSAMPLLLSRKEGVGGRRVLPLGLQPVKVGLAHEIIAVDLEKKSCRRFTELAPSSALATASACGPKSARQGETEPGTAGSTEVDVKRAGETLWTMKVTRASASSGSFGSGVEIESIKYKGDLVLAKAHTPILNVNYVNDKCGPFRDAVNYENAFNADGRRVASGIVIADKQPTTIFDTRDDRGNFWGVALYQDKDVFIVMSELSAGWYRYVNEYRFYPDGSIQPLFRFDAVYNSCTCEPHDHHVYWRLDFDLAGGKNSAHVLGSSGWNQVKQEKKHLRGPEFQSWRVLGPDGRSGYEITPGPHDEPSNAFGRGDAWILREYAKEADESKLSDKVEAKLDYWVNGEDVRNQDLVFWYGGHIRHGPGDHESPYVVGPMLKPVTLESSTR